MVMMAVATKVTRVDEEEKTVKIVNGDEKAERNNLPISSIVNEDEKGANIVPTLGRALD